MLHNAFDLVEEREIPEINAVAYRYRHKKTHADVLSICCDDDNKVFATTFKTPPKDSTGVAHIVEHSVFCGSKKYPVKEPFIELMKGSVQTFLNAMTYPDKTIYPIASPNTQDYYNLMDVYLDAVFNTTMDELTLAQEGWHIHWKTLTEDPEFKGVVYNEMKGVYSSTDSIVYEKVQQSIFPDTTYGLDSGGNPPDIRNLSYENFNQFYKTHYHPSNSRIFFYGDDDPLLRLQKLEEYLQPFEKLELDTHIDKQPRFDKLKELIINIPSDEEDEDSHYVVVSWLLGEPENLNEQLAINLLSYLLIGNSASPLRRSLIESGLGEDLFGAGLENHLQEMYFSTGLKGVSFSDIEKTKSLINECIAGLAKDGFSNSFVDSVLNTIEFGLRENNTGSFPRGLTSLLKSLTAWVYDRDPLDPLAYESQLAELKSTLDTNPNYLKDLLSKYFISNTHKTILLAKPDRSYQQRLEDEEQTALTDRISALSEPEKEELIAKTKELEAKQSKEDSDEALSSIPTLSLHDLDPKVLIIEQERFNMAGVPILFHPQATSGITYIDLAFNLSHIPLSDFPLLPLFSQSLKEHGTLREDYIQLSERIGKETGGISTEVYTDEHYQSGEAIAHLLISGKVLNTELPKLLAIFQDMLLTPNTDLPDRFNQLCLEEKSGEESKIVPVGNTVVRDRYSSHFSIADQLNEVLDGVSYLKSIRSLCKDADTKWSGVAENLKRLHHSIFSRENLSIQITSDPNLIASSSECLSDFITSLPQGTTPKKATWDQITYPDHECLLFPSQVNFVGKAYDLKAVGYQHHASSLVATRLLNAQYLWNEVRVKGGAYGAGCRTRRNTGMIGFASYRDPNIEQTLLAYDQAAHFLSNIELSEKELTRSIVGSVGAISPYRLPDAKGHHSFIRHLNGITEADRQQIRDEVFSTELSHIQRFGDILYEARKHTKHAILCNQQAANQLQKNSPLDISMTNINEH